MAGMEVVVLPVDEIEHIKSLPETELSIKYATAVQARTCI